MPYAITQRCIQCDNCRPECPTGAITIEGDEYWIDPGLCNNCQGYYSEPQCVVSCPVNSPIPLQAKKGRCKVEARTAVSPDLFPDGKSNPFASAMAVWELCNILAQRQSLPWENDDSGQLRYKRPVNQGRGSMTFWVAAPLNADSLQSPASTSTLSPVKALDIRAACLHLIYAAYATTLDVPWEEEFVISDRQLEKYLGLEKRKDMSKAAKLALIKDLAQQPCRVQVSIDWPRQGKVPGLSTEKSPLWHLLGIQHHFQKDSHGCRHLVGLTFRVRAGHWTRYFLNKQGCKQQTAFYQYGNLPFSLLGTVMSIWQQHEGAARLILWLLFKTKMGREQRITIPTLMRVAYGAEKVTQAAAQREGRKRLLRTFESDLEALNHYGLKPVFDPDTYPPEIQPLWAKLVDLPDDAEAALEFWTNDGNTGNRLTDPAPRGKWNRLMHARISCFELPEEWERQLAKLEQTKQRKSKRKSKAKTQLRLSASQIIAARQNLGLSQRTLAQQVGKSQSWIRDVENGRFQINTKDQTLLCEVLGIAQELAAASSA